MAFRTIAPKAPIRFPASQKAPVKPSDLTSYLRAFMPQFKKPFQG